jgi:hypothetical protein
MQALDASTESLLAAHGETGLGLLTSYHTNQAEEIKPKILGTS